jgi:tRNA/tmRNA/rRNA uracil-C5-methylase (TrmA/RlmC/RlmD family)
VKIEPKEKEYRFEFVITEWINAQSQSEAEEMMMSEVITRLQGLDPATLMDNYCTLRTQVNGMANRLNTVTTSNPRMDYITSDDEGEAE